MDWAGWERPWRDLDLKDGEVCKIRRRAVSGGLAPQETVWETRAVWRQETGWEDMDGRRIGFVGNIIAWRPLTPQERACYW
jgi:hypothetical protein